jgi:translation initiation factor IF-2
MARKLSRELGVEIKHYSIIYEAIEEIKLALEGLLRPDIVEEPIGTAKVRDIFKVPKLGMIAGCYIEKGKVIRNSKLRLLRAGEVIYEGKLTSLKR